MIIEKIRADLQHATDSLRTMHEELKSFFEAVPDPFFIIDKDGYCLDILGGTSVNTYLDIDSIRGKNIKDVFPGGIADRFLSAIRNSMQSNSLVAIEYNLSTSDIHGVVADGEDETKWFEGRVFPIKNRAGSNAAVGWQAIDITEKKLLETELRQMAETDPLTGAFNRRYFSQLFEKEFASSKKHEMPLSFLMLDIDHFKHFNDTFGHDAGDMILKKLTIICSPILRDTDLFARFGGDEFAILLPKTPVNGAYLIADRIREKINQNHLEANGRKIEFSVSIGVSEMLAYDNRIEDVFKRADLALYEAKQSGRNSVCISESGPSQKL